MDIVYIFVITAFFITLTGLAWGCAKVGGQL